MSDTGMRRDWAEYNYMTELIGQGGTQLRRVRVFAPLCVWAALGEL